MNPAAACCMWPISAVTHSYKAIRCHAVALLAENPDEGLDATKDDVPDQDSMELQQPENGEFVCTLQSAMLLSAFSRTMMPMLQLLFAFADKNSSAIGLL